MVDGKPMTVTLKGSALAALKELEAKHKAKRARAAAKREARRKRYCATQGRRDVGHRGPLRLLVRLTREAHKLRRNYMAQSG